MTRVNAFLCCFVVSLAAMPLSAQTAKEEPWLDLQSASLGVPLHSPALLFERVTRATTGDVIEFTSSTYRGDRYRLETELGLGGRPAQPLEIAPVALR